MLELHDVPAYLFGFLSACCVMALLWCAAVIVEEFWRWKSEGRDDLQNP